MACPAGIRLDRLADPAMQHRTASSSGIPHKGYYATTIRFLIACASNALLRCQADDTGKTALARLIPAYQNRRRTTLQSDPPQLNAVGPLHGSPIDLCTGPHLAKKSCYYRGWSATQLLLRTITKTPLNGDPPRPSLLQTRARIYLQVNVTQPCISRISTP